MSLPFAPHRPRMGEIVLRYLGIDCHNPDHLKIDFHVAVARLEYLIKMHDLIRQMKVLRKMTHGQESKFLVSMLDIYCKHGLLFKQFHVTHHVAPEAVRLAQGRLRRKRTSPEAPESPTTVMATPIDTEDAADILIHMTSPPLKRRST